MEEKRWTDEVMMEGKKEIMFWKKEGEKAGEKDLEDRRFWEKMMFIRMEETVKMREEKMEEEKRKKKEERKAWKIKNGRWRRGGKRGRRRKRR